MTQPNSMADSIEAAAEMSMYDAAVKRLLSEKEVLARIVQGAVSEVSDLTIQEIIDSIEGTPQVSTTPLTPGLTNNPHINGKSTEDNVLYEGRVLFDIVFDFVNAKLPRSKFIINVEAQKNSNPGYDLASRAIFYCARLISSQLDREFVNHIQQGSKQYSDIKKVYSIWVCMDTTKRNSNSIVRYDIQPKVEYGNPNVSDGYDLMSAVMLYLGDQSEDSDNRLIGFLSDLLKRESAEEKENRLLRRHGIAMTEEMTKGVSSMCNLSEAIKELGVQQGLAQGLQATVASLYAANVPLDQIYTIVKGQKNYANVTETEILTLYQEAKQDANKN